ncbi:hypothetical protein DGMP_06560 [Desulfomarina profundi]|uniref:Bacteriophage Mu GpT domain-containing protein n=1 Tax=Desulfomarina profundi TaxID=2772557 RepID=A0A8D5FJE8_9BACT|nr:Mu-like prophage major head subunit gpT family protein [Desulfomarina profundi]BCL59963.1 hypothetical protein DGMP_06560 [Desulfomarina profundi]
MNEKLRKFLEANGLRADATEQQAWDLYYQLKDDGIDLPGIDPGQRSAPGDPGETGGRGDGNGDSDPGPGAGDPAAVQTSQAGSRSYSKEELDEIVNQQTVRALAADAERRSAVQSLINVAGVADLDNGDFARSLVNNPEITAERASNLILTELQKRNKPLGTGTMSAQVGMEAGEKLRSAVTHGLMMRSGIAVEEPAAGAGEFRGRSLLEICRELLEMDGVNCRAMSRLEIAGRALAANSTSDFPHIFAALVNKTLLAAYNEWPATWRPFVAVTSAMDFKEIHAIKLSGSPDLKGLGENGEYKRAEFSDAQESYKIITKGILVALTRQMIINDDLRAFTRIPQLFGVSARRFESAAVYALITGNPTMSDGKALFHADHKNLASSGTALTSASLGVGRAAMRKQKGLAGESIDVQPAFLLTPVVKETDAEVLLRSSALPESNMSAGVHNPWAGKLTPIADPLLDAASETAWYLLAHPNQVPVIEAAYLEGEEQPYVEEQIDFKSDALEIKCRHDFGTGVVDHVGAYKNPGA